MQNIVNSWITVLIFKEIRRKWYVTNKKKANFIPKLFSLPPRAHVVVRYTAYSKTINLKLIVTTTKHIKQTIQSINLNTLNETQNRTLQRSKDTIVFFYYLFYILLVSFKEKTILTKIKSHSIA